MSTELKGKIKSEIKKRNFNPTGILQTIKNSINGFLCYIKDGKSIILYVLGVIIEVLMSIVYSITTFEWIMIIFMLGIILAIELLNTAIEAACDAITKEYNDFIKIAKDCGSASTFVIVIMTILLNVVIFLPRIVGLINI